MDYVFVIIALFTVGSSIAIFVEKKLLHSVLALTMAFLGSALIFISLGQTLVALLQLFVLVGGLSTYLIVAVASDENKREINLSGFFVALAVLGIAMSIFSQSSVLSILYDNSFINSMALVFSNYYIVFYILVFMLLSTTIGSILVLRKFVKLIV